MGYGDLPKSLGIHNVKCHEMMFYQYLPIKLAGTVHPSLEDRLNIFNNLIGACNCDFIAEFGLSNYINSNIYLTIKHQYQTTDCSFNRPGWHSDGFMTDDINYIWCDINPTTFNTSSFDLSQCHQVSMIEMDNQAFPSNNIRYDENELLRLDQFNIHKVTELHEPGFRTFFKLSFSTDRYNLIGNSRNYLLDYNWVMKNRNSERNHPSK